SWLTLRRASAPLTHSGPLARSTRQMSEDTPPASATAGGVSPGAARRASRRKLRTGSGSEALNGPAGILAGVEQPVVQPVGAPLPELDGVRPHAVPAPLRRPRRVIRMALADRAHRAFQEFPRRHFLALRRGPCRVARAERAAGVVGVRRGRRDFLHGA